MARNPMRAAELSSSAARLQTLLRARGEYGHVAARAARGHIVIEVLTAGGPADTIARASPLGGGTYGLGFRSHSGRWEPMPVVGTLEEVAAGAVDLLGPYLDPDNL